MIIFNNTTEDEPTSLGMVALSGNRAASAILEDHFADRSVTIDIVLSREKYFKGTKYRVQRKRHSGVCPAKQIPRYYFC